MGEASTGPKGYDLLELVPPGVLKECSRKVKSNCAEDYGLEMDLHHQNLYAHHEAKSNFWKVLLLDPAPYLIGATMSYGLLRRMQFEGIIILPSDADIQNVLSKSETLRDAVQKRQKEIKKLVSSDGISLTNEEDIELLQDPINALSRSRELKSSMRPYFDTGLQMLGRIRREPIGRLQEDFELSTGEVVRQVTNNEVAVNTIDLRNTASTKLFMAGFAETLLILRDCQDMNQLLDTERDT